MAYLLVDKKILVIKVNWSLPWSHSETVYFNKHIQKSVLTIWSVFPIAGCNPVAIIKWGGWQVVRFYHASPNLYPARLLARSSPFQGEGTGSIPVQDTKFCSDDPNVNTRV